jgi:hypothetical protein
VHIWFSSKSIGPTRGHVIGASASHTTHPAREFPGPPTDRGIGEVNVDTKSA